MQFILYLNVNNVVWILVRCFVIIIMASNMPNIEEYRRISLYWDIGVRENHPGIFYSLHIRVRIGLFEVCWYDRFDPEHQIKHLVRR